MTVHQRAVRPVDDHPAWCEPQDAAIDFDHREGLRLAGPAAFAFSREYPLRNELCIDRRSSERPEKSRKKQPLRNTHSVA
jgi:hypothetical protein